MGFTVGTAATLPPSYIRYTGCPGRGTTNTNILRWSTLAESAGSDIVYAASSTNGDSFTVITAGVYSVVVSLLVPASVTGVILMAGSSLVNTMNGNETQFKVPQYFAANTYGCISWVGYLAANDNIFVNSAQTPNNGFPKYNSISVVKIR